MRMEALRLLIFALCALGAAEVSRAQDQDDPWDYGPTAAVIAARPGAWGNFEFAGAGAMQSKITRIVCPERTNEFAFLAAQSGSFIATCAYITRAGNEPYIQATSFAHPLPGMITQMHDAARTVPLAGSFQERTESIGDCEITVFSGKTPDGTGVYSLRDFLINDIFYSFRTFERSGAPTESVLQTADELMRRTTDIVCEPKSTS